MINDVTLNKKTALFLELSSYIIEKNLELLLNKNNLLWMHIRTKIKFFDSFGIDSII